jgi:hypothetical protein
MIRGGSVELILPKFGQPIQANPLLPIVSIVCD